jgi:hypothetical protein
VISTLDREQFIDVFVKKLTNYRNGDDEYTSSFDERSIDASYSLDALLQSIKLGANVQQPSIVHLFVDGLPICNNATTVDLLFKLINRIDIQVQFR